MSVADGTTRPATNGSAESAAFPGLSQVSALASGGMGSVFRAWQDDLARPVAVKTLRRDLRGDARLTEMFQREAHILARLDHPGIVPVHYAGECATGPYYVMRLVEGVSIDEFLAGKPAAEIATVFQGVADALATAHREGVLHRDIKPANVLVEPTGRALLVDFGLSTRTHAGAAPVAPENLVGTPDYLAPELLAGERYSRASDIYALGATLYSTLTGRAPFPGADLGEKLRAIREDDPPLPRTLRSDVPKPLQAICLKAMERSPADRYASAEELARDLERFVQGDVVQALPVRSRSMLRRRIELHLTDVSDWLEQGLIDEGQRAALQRAYEHVDERGRNLLRGVLGSVPNLLLLVGILLCVFGPVLLALLTWEEMAVPVRLGLPATPLCLLALLGAWRWRAQDRRRGVACLFGAALLVAPLGFALVDLVPALRAVRDETGALHAVLPGDLWLPTTEAPAWMQTGSHLLHWKLFMTSGVTLAVAIALHARLRAAIFLWIACVAGAGAIVCAALLSGWRGLSPVVQWSVAMLGSLATLALGFRFDRSFERERAQPFYGLAFAALIIVAMAFAETGVPFSVLGMADERDASSCSVLSHGLAFVAAGLLMHARGTPLLRQVAGAPLFAGFALTIVALSTFAAFHGTWFEILLVAGCAGFLVLGLGLQRNLLVLPAAIVLPITVGSVSQRHVQGLWAWSAAIVIGGATLVLLSFRLSARRDASRSRG